MSFINNNPYDIIVWIIVYVFGFGGTDMVDVLCKALSFLLVIFLGYFIKKKGLVDKTFRDGITKLALDITLPAAVISSFLSFEKNNSLYMLMILGLVFNFFMIFVGFIFSLKKERKQYNRHD